MQSFDCKAATLPHATMRGSCCKCYLCMFSGHIAEYWLVMYHFVEYCSYMFLVIALLGLGVGQFAEYYLKRNSVIVRAGHGVRFGSVLGKTQ